MDNVVLPNKIVVAVDAIVLAIGKNGLDVLLTNIKSGPYQGCWALPGSVVGADESLDNAAKRVISQRVTDNDLHIEQLYCFGEIDRDIRGRSVSVAYFALLGQQSEVLPKLNDLYSEIKWFSVDQLPLMAFDHQKIIMVAKEKLAYKLDEKDIIKRLLPDKFTLGELRRVHEVLSGKEIDKRNFIKKIKNDGEVVVTNEMKTGGAFRPAKLFRFK